MAIHLEKFNPRLFTTEKVSFQLSSKCFHVGQGDADTRAGIDDDGLRESPLWRGWRSNVEFRKLLWDECRKHLPEYLANRNKGRIGFYLPHLLSLVEAANQQDIKLVYIDDLEHAELIKRCIEWLATQIQLGIPPQVKSPKKIKPCSRCGIEIYFNRSEDRTLPYNSDGTAHHCSRRHLFGKTNIKCPGCEALIERDSGKYQADGQGKFLRWFPSEDWRSLSCPCCNWGFNWHVSQTNYDYDYVEPALRSLSQDELMKVGYGQLEIVPLEPCPSNQ